MLLRMASPPTCGSRHTYRMLRHQGRQSACLTCEIGVELQCLTCLWVLAHNLLEVDMSDLD